MHIETKPLFASDIFLNIANTNGEKTTILWVSSSPTKKFITLLKPINETTVANKAIKTNNNLIDSNLFFSDNLETLLFNGSIKSLKITVEQDKSKVSTVDNDADIIPMKSNEEI